MVMNGIYLVIISACVLMLAYRFYGAFIAAKVLTVNQYKVTPAVAHDDGEDEGRKVAPKPIYRHFLSSFKYNGAIMGQG